MPQQINLSAPVQAASTQKFTAQNMGIALLAFLVLGSALCGTLVWRQQKATQTYMGVAAVQAKEIDDIKAAIVRNKAAVKPQDAGLQQQLQTQRTALQQRELLLQGLLDGRFQPGWGHSDRLQLLANSIPDPVWVTEVKADAARLEVAGFTLEPAALNQWVDRLSASPLMRGLRLATVQVENTTKGLVGAAATPVAAPTVAPAVTPVSTERPQWSFNLVSAQTAPPPAMPAAPGVSSNPGGKP